MLDNPQTRALIFIVEDMDTHERARVTHMVSPALDVFQKVEDELTTFDNAGLMVVAWHVKDTGQNYYG